MMIVNMNADSEDKFALKHPFLSTLLTICAVDIIIMDTIKIIKEYRKIKNNG